MIAFVSLSMCLQFVATAIVDGLVQDYLNEEKNLWHLVRSTNVNSNDDSLLHIYETHRHILSMEFGETGAFDAFSKQDRTILAENRVMERHIMRVTDSMHHINITTLNTLRILDNSHYEEMPNLMKDVLRNMPKLISTLNKYINSEFWIFLKNVIVIHIQIFNFPSMLILSLESFQNSQYCMTNQVLVLSENEALLNFYNEIVAAILKSYMLLQMSFMVYTVDNLGK